MAMRPEIQAYLDGELGLAELPAELRELAVRWERTLDSVRETLGSPGAPAGLDRRIQRALDARRRPTWRRAVEWAVRPRSVRVSPLAGLAAAAALALLTVWPWSGAREPVLETTASGTIVYVQFMVEAPGARSVALAGDFTGWAPRVTLEDPEDDGIWTGRVALQPGVHEYMFVVDGTRWITDPRAQRYADDGFGNRNAVLVIPRPTMRS